MDDTDNITDEARLLVKYAPVIAQVPEQHRDGFIEGLNAGLAGVKDNPTEAFRLAETSALMLTLAGQPTPADVLATDSPSAGYVTGFMFYIEDFRAFCREVGYEV